MDQRTGAAPGGPNGIVSTMCDYRMVNGDIPYAPASDIPNRLPPSRSSSAAADAGGLAGAAPYPGRAWPPWHALSRPRLRKGTGPVRLEVLSPFSGIPRFTFCRSRASGGWESLS